MFYSVVLLKLLQTATHLSSDFLNLLYNLLTRLISVAVLRKKLRGSCSEKVPKSHQLTAPWLHGRPFGSTNMMHNIVYVTS